jgi:tetratricopeptide (TPR) repeat protein
MNTPLSQHPDPPASTADATVSGGLNRLTIVHLLVVGIAIGAVIAAFASVERRDAISLSQTAEADAWTGMRIVEQGASAAEDYEALARQHFDAAVARARPGQRMAERIGVWLAERGQFGLATPYLLQGLRQSPGYDLALTAASAASAVGDSAATTEAYTMAIQLRPDSPLAYNNLAYHYAVRGVRLPEAERLAQRALQLVAPGSLEASSYWDTLAWVLYKQGRFAEAWQAMANVDPLFFSDPVVVDHLRAIEDALRGPPMIAPEFEGFRPEED